ncbi:type II toxin-antitoxin system RelE/ParE family toxin [Candidatus Pacearchaeota archaeon]|nr:type II toxin-antitoxin system RelE/ParE family toxin [Candidatus Pacearchaeota archaeon]
MEYVLILSKKFEKEFERLDNSIKNEAWKKIERLKNNPENTGKHLRHLNLWELKIRMYRVFYFIDKSQIRILLLSVKHKDETDKYVRGLSLDEIKQLLNGVS